MIDLVSTREGLVVHANRLHVKMSGAGSMARLVRS